MIFGNDFIKLVNTTKYDPGDDMIVVKVGETNPFVIKITSFRFSKKERIQIVPCLNDTIHVYAYGKDVENSSLDGFAFKKDIAPAKKWYEDNRIYIMDEDSLGIKIAYGESIFTGRLISMTSSVMADNPAIMQVSFSFIGLGD